MRRVSEIMFFAVLIILLLSSGRTVSSIRSGWLFNSSGLIKDDTTGLTNLLKVDAFKLAIIPPSSGIQFYKDKIVFLSMSKNEKKMSANQISFGTVEAYYASVEDSMPGRRMIFSPLSSFSYPCEAITFTKDYNTLYFTMIPKKEKKERIFMAKFISTAKNQSGLIPESTPLNFCTGNSNYTHPTLSFDEKMMIFASDNGGSMGGMDLFVSRRMGEKWSLPENLGKLINTAGNEFFPFLDVDNNLFYSSDKLPGYGGYDVFTCKFNGTGWNQPVNLSAHINSEYDDIAFIINKTDGKSAFFTRKKRSGKGDMQLYQVNLKQEAGNKNLLTISDIFNVKSVPVISPVAVAAEKEIKPDIKETVKPKPEVEVLKTEKVKVPEKAVPVPAIQKDVVIYRIQLLSETKQRSSREIVINGINYHLYQYFYLGAYRYTIGEFSTLARAKELQNLCRRSGHPQAFVVAFKNDIRSLDMSLFK